MTHKTGAKRAIGLEGYFFTLTIFLSVCSVLFLALLSTDRFFPLPVAGAAGAAAILTGVLSRRLWAQRKLNRGEWLIAAAAALALVVRANPAPYLFGGQDPGVYTSMAGHFAARGTLVVHDLLLPELSDAPDLRAYYLDRSIRNVARGADGTWFGNMVAGVYLWDLPKNEWHFQFYAVSPIWLAVGQWIFGIEWQGLIISLFSALTVIGVGLIGARLTGSLGGGALAAVLLALNPAHAAIAALPVSEGVAGFFFVAGAALLITPARILSVLPFSALFLTRITGFVTLPLLLLSIGWMVLKRRDRSAMWTGLGLIGVYAASFYWGLHFSPWYSRGIYEGKLGVSTEHLVFAPLLFVCVAVGWLGVCQIALARPPWVRSAVRFGVRWGAACLLGAAAILVVTAIYRGCLIGFTEHYRGHRWFDKRWEMVGGGIASVRLLSVHTLAVMLSYSGAAAFLLGLVQAAKVGVKRGALAPIALLAGGFLGVFSLKPLTTPYLYYFGRYLVSELLPLAIICCAAGVCHLALRYPRGQRMVYGGYLALVFASLWSPFVVRLSLREGQEFHDAVSSLSAATPGKSVILVDKTGLPESPLVTPLRLTYQKATFSLRYGDFSAPGKLDALFDYFEAKGYSVYVVSSQKVWSKLPGLHPLGKLTLTMRTLSGKGALPVRIRTREHGAALYKVQRGGVEG